MRKPLIIAAIPVLAVAVGASYAFWHVDELPPANAMRLSEIIRLLEDKGMKTVTEIEYDGGVWKIEVHQADGKEVTLRVNPVTAEIQ
jgi:hypothetical protein